MSFSDLDYSENTYTKSSMKGIDQKPVQIIKNKDWELQFNCESRKAHGEYFN